MNIVFAEGKSDVYFLKKIHDRFNNKRDYDTFLAETADIQQLDWLRNHITEDKYSYLYKSEEGKSAVIEYLRTTAPFLSDKSLYVLIDLDNQTPGQLIGEMENKFQEDIADNKVRVKRNRSDSNSHMCIVDTELHSPGAETEICIMAFNRDLEDAAGILSGDSRPEKHKKISRFIQKNKSVASDIADRLFDQ